jgi:hypothetical protein
MYRLSYFIFDLEKKYLPKNNSSLPGLEPGIFRFEVERVIHYATGPRDE